jgi:hypothetical protein
MNYSKDIYHLLDGLDSESSLCGQEKVGNRYCVIRDINNMPPHIRFCTKCKRMEEERLSLENWKNLAAEFEQDKADFAAKVESICDAPGKKTI